MKSSAPFKGAPAAAEGRVCVEYFDPRTLKVKERIKGKNYVYLDSFFGDTDWAGTMRTVPMFLTDNIADIDPDLPYLKNNIIGYGIPGEGGAGDYKGTWNTVNSFLLQGNPQLGTITSKFVYDFTPSQVQQEVKTIGLSWQFLNPNYGRYAHKALKTSLVPNSTSNSNITHIAYKGKNYQFAAGKVLVTDIVTGTTTECDLTALLGTSSYYRTIGINPTNDHFYIKVYSSVAADRKLYEFEDDTFSTLLNTYTISTWEWSGDVAFAVYGNYLYLPYSSLYSINYTTDAEYTVSSGPQPNTIISNYLGLSSISKYGVSIVGKYMLSGSTGGNYSALGYVLDLSTGTFVALHAMNVKSVDMRLLRNPLAATDKAVVYCSLSTSSSNTRLVNAVAAYKLPVDAPARPAGYGMTIAYELEVQY